MMLLNGCMGVNLLGWFELVKIFSSLVGRLIAVRLGNGLTCSIAARATRLSVNKIFTGQKLLSIASIAMSLLLSGTLYAQPTSPLPYLKSEPASAQSSYEARIVNRQGVHDMDPNIYVYTPDFANRFQMPSQWSSADLKGVDAVAFRVVPGYKSCGWGGNPNSCREDEVRCEMDLYFEHQKNPLPWDLRINPSQIDRSKTTAAFIASSANPLHRPKGSLIDTYRSPFTDPTTGKELGWQEEHGNGGGWTGALSYDREIFAGMSLVTLGTSCTSPAREIWLTSQGLYSNEVTKSPALNRRIILPVSWQARVKQALAQTDERNKAFFQQEGEKALKALRENPVPSKPIVPLQ